MFAVCAIAKDEPEHYVREWLDWHRSAGVDRFFIYDNGGWVVRRNDVTVLPCIGERMQVPAYNHCLRNCGNADFLAFLDLDEFMIGPVVERLKTVENALALNWKLFGSSGLEWNPCGRQMGVFRLHMRPNMGVCAHVKCVVRPSRTIRMANPHHGEYVGSGTQETFEGRRFLGAFNPMEGFEGAWINHYFTRSIYDWRKKAAKGGADIVSKRRPEGVYLIDGCCTEAEDGGAVPSKELLPRVAEARYGTPESHVVVTERVREACEGGSGFGIGAGQYNGVFGDPAPGKIKRFYMRFEVAGRQVAEIDVGEDEGFGMP